jgi:uncharacterized protein (DUF2141 family)
LTLPTTADGDGDGDGVGDSGAIMLTVEFSGTVTEDSPIIVEARSGKQGEALSRAVLPLADLTITLDGVPADTLVVVALFHDQNDNGVWDRADEPLAFYKNNVAGQAVGPTGDPTELRLAPAQTLDIGTVSLDRGSTGPIVEVDTGAITLTPVFAGTVSAQSPIIVDVKPSQDAAPVKRVVLSESDVTTTIGGLAVDTTWVVALFYDENGNGAWDAADEPLVLFNEDATDNTVEPSGTPTTITLAADETLDIGTLSFGDEPAPPPPPPPADDSTGAITVAVSFTGTDVVGEDSPIIVEVKEDQMAGPISSAVLTSADTTVTIDGLATDTTYVVAVFHDINDNGAWDAADEPLVYYNKDSSNQAVGPTGTPTEIAILPGETVDIGTVSFSDGEES